MATSDVDVHAFIDIRIMHQNKREAGKRTSLYAMMFFISDDGSFYIESNLGVDNRSLYGFYLTEATYPTGRIKADYIYTGIQTKVCLDKETSQMPNYHSPI